MAKRTINIRSDMSPDWKAITVASYWTNWSKARDKKMKEWAELRNYIFATDTSTTSNSSLPWKNKTTRPKICQIRDNLHANYMAALFPHDKWFTWVPATENSADFDKAQAIIAYMQTKLSNSQFEQEVSRLVLDYIDYGNCFADVQYVTDRAETMDGIVDVYVGPQIKRISPLDIAFDPTASNFRSSPKIIRELYSLGDLAKLVRTYPETTSYADAFQKVIDLRNTCRTWEKADIIKDEGFVADGFGNIREYLDSGLVEVLEFEGDWFDVHNQVLYENWKIVIVDRLHVAYNGPINNWHGRSHKEHAGWRLRPDNLWAMGPLDNLVGMQYRIDHLENLKADVFDLIAFPVVKIKGEVEDFAWEPGARIYLGEEGDVGMLAPETTALNADMQIRLLEDEMEEMAGAPKQAMGIRTPGEKTAYEVQTLENAAGRIFQSKVSYFEKHFLEPLLNSMLESAARNLDGTDVARAIDDDYGIQMFLTITKDDLAPAGRINPRGARHFAMKAQLVQNLTQLANSNIYQDPAVQAHLSGLKIAKLMEENLGLTGYGIFGKDIRLQETADSQRTQMAIQDSLQAESVTPTDQASLDAEMQAMQQGQ
jgi:hypothetical protein